MGIKHQYKSRPKRQYPDHLKYAMYVLWLHGYSYSQIASALQKFAQFRLEAKNVDAIIRRSPYNRRKDMDDAERQQHLDILKSERIDRAGGIVIKDWAFKADPITDRRQNGS